MYNGKSTFYWIIGVYINNLSATTFLKHLMKLMTVSMVTKLWIDCITSDGFAEAEVPNGLFSVLNVGSGHVISLLIMLII